MTDSRGNDADHLDEPRPYSDPYAALDVPRDATLDAIKDAYFNLVREHPP